MSRAEATTENLPSINKPMMGGFRIFNRKYLRKHFHAIAISYAADEVRQISPSDSIVIYANHASWWDPLLAIFLAETVFPTHGMYAPIDAEAFEKYRFFGKMGFYPIAQDSLQGAKNFLRTSKNILSRPGNSIWITPEGRFADPRDHSAPLMPGLAHLAHSMQNNAPQSGAGDAAERPTVWFVPAAIEYSFWEEKKPEILVRFGTPLGTSDDSASDKSSWTSTLVDRLRSAQKELADLAISRDAEAFEVALRSQSGTFFLYDWWRSSMNRLRGKKFSTEHSDKF